jgi:Mg2+ and Co2+ transporter CorA
VTENPPFEVHFLDHPTERELLSALEHFEESLSGGRMHPTARRGMMSGDEISFQEPFPKIESHDAYLYGMLATPTDIDDGRSEFFTIKFLIQERMSVVVLWGPQEHAGMRSRQLFARISRLAADSLPSSIQTPSEPGDVFVQLARVILDDLQVLISGLHRSVSKEMVRIESQMFDEMYQSMSTEASDTYKRIRRLKFEILSIAPTINETQNVFKAITSRQVIIRPPFVVGDAESPPFSPNHRIWIDGLLMRARSLKAQRNGLEQEVRLLYERLESLENLRQTAAQMRFAAVASILLLPALIVGFFGQNFNVNPWTESRWSWAVSVAFLGILAAVQIIYFKKNKWF